MRSRSLQPAPEAETSIALAYRFQPGDRTLLAIRCQQDVSTVVDPEQMGLEGGNPEVPHLVLTPEGELETLVYQVTPSEIWLGAHFRQFSMQNRKVSSTSEETLDPFRTEFLIRLDPQGRILEFVFDKEIDPGIALLLRGMLLPFQVVLPEQPASSWSASETDATGQFQARYLAEHFLDANGVTQARISKSFDRYERLFAPGTTSSEIDCTARASFDLTSGYLRSMEVRCQMKMRSDRAGQTLEAQMKGTLKLLSRDRSDLSASALTRRFDRLRRDGIPVAGGAEDLLARVAQANHQRQIASELQGVKLEDLLRVFATSERTKGAHSRAEYEAQRLMTHLFATNEATIQEVLSLLASGALDERSVAAILSALGSAATEAAEKALVTVASDDTSTLQIQLQATVALGMSTHGSLDSEEYLRTASESDESELSSTATLALGALSQTLLEQNPDRANSIAMELGNQLDRATSEEDRCLTLEAMGNAANPINLESVLESVNTSSEAQRCSAVHALRKYPQPEVESMLVASLERDTSESVQIAAARSLKGRDSAATTRALEQAIQSGSEELQRAAQRSLDS